MAGEPRDFFGMSDEDFAKLSPSSIGSDEGASASSTASEEGTETVVEKSDDVVVADDTGDSSAAASGTDGDAAASTEKVEEDDTTGKTEEEKPADGNPASTAKPADGKVEPGKEAGTSGDGKAASETGEVKTPSVIQAAKDLSREDLDSFYDSVINKPIKANGRDIVLKNKDEVLRMIQMGAGYGRKLQDIQPHLKTIRMLEKNNLLNEADLNYLIDLKQKNPDAIKKLIKDSGIDPLDLNTEDNASYRPNNHAVSDNEVAFSEALSDVSAQPTGQETIRIINTTWDQTSKEAMWAQPELLRIIQTQRENGLFDQITTEMDRKKLLGEISPTTPFLEAYKMAGDALVATNSLIMPKDASASSTSKPSTAAAETQAQRVLGTRTAAAKSSSAANNEQAKAAASTQGTSRKAKETVNPLSMSDEDFLKEFNGRL